MMKEDFLKIVEDYVHPAYLQQPFVPLADHSFRGIRNNEEFLDKAVHLLLRQSLAHDVLSYERPEDL